MEDEGRKVLKLLFKTKKRMALKRPRVNSGSEDGKRALKRPCNDLSESVTDGAASGREAHVHLKRKRSCEDLVENPSSASATAGKRLFANNAEVTGGSIFKILADRKALKCPHEKDLVNSASATTGTGGYTVTPITLRVDPAAYAYNRSEIWYVDHIKNGRTVREVRCPRVRPHDDGKWPKESGKRPNMEYVKWLRENYESLVSPVANLKQ